MATYKNGNGNGGSGSPSIWALVISGIAVVLTLVGQFWSLANPRDDLKQLKADFKAEIDAVKHIADNKLLPISTHIEYANRKDKDTDRLDLDIKKIQSTYVTKEDLTQFRMDNNSRIEALRERVTDVQKEFAGSYNIGKQLDSQQKQIDYLIRRLSDPTSPQPWPKDKIQP